MDNLRTYGAEPYDLVLLHGGPGAPGSFESLARRLSISFGILEPFLLSFSIKDQIEELYSIVEQHSSGPLFFIGHSWGAWLGCLFASSYPEQVRKVIMIGAPPFSEEFAPKINETRNSRLTDSEKKDFTMALQQLEVVNPDSNILPPILATLLSKTDIFEALAGEKITSKFYPDVYRSIWTEATAMRRTGRLMEYVKEIRCPVVAIHGDFDPHPAEGVRNPLAEILPNFRFNLIERCGHYPWKEKFGKDILYKILYKEMGSTCV